MRIALYTVWDTAEYLAAHCNKQECPVLGESGPDNWPMFHCPFIRKDCQDITPADWQALEVKNED